MLMLEHKNTPNGGFNQDQGIKKIKLFACIATQFSSVVAI